MTKTNVIRILESKKIPHTVHEYIVDEEDLSGESVAKKVGADVDEVFKTLVAVGDRTGVNVFCIPVSLELNLKKAAAASGNKSIEMLKQKDLLPTTGYIRGGCSPVGMKKKFPTFIDETARLFEEIYVSAGARGIQIRLVPSDLASAAEAKFADLV